MKVFYLLFALRGVVWVLHVCRSHRHAARALFLRVLVFGKGGGVVGVER